LEEVKKMAILIPMIGASIQAAKNCPTPNNGIWGGISDSADWVEGAVLGLILGVWPVLVIALVVVALLGIFGPDNGAKWFKKIGVVLGLVIAGALVLSIGDAVITNVYKNC
jgi:hypothetical protein